MKNKLQRISRFFYNYLILKNLKIALIFSKYPISRYQNQYYQMLCADKGILLKSINLFIPIISIDKFQADFELINRIVGFANISFENDEMIVSVVFNNNTTRIIIRNYDSLSTVEDIFSFKIYSFDPSSTDDYIVIDIGMNIGIAALYFATFPYVKKVYGYEPFKLNYLLAEYNFKLNPELSPKITPVNSGVASISRGISLPDINEGDVGFSTTEVDNTTKAGDKNYVEVSLIGINEVVKLITTTNFNGEKIYLKLDCEGAEYEVLHELSNSGAINAITVIELEWHHKGPDTLIDILKKNNFQIIFSDENNNGFTGIIKAKKQ